MNKAPVQTFFLIQSFISTGFKTEAQIVFLTPFLIYSSQLFLTTILI